MNKVAFISRHLPTAEQISLAAEDGFELIHVGDCDAFSIDSGFVYEHGAYEYVCVVHPAAALRLASNFVILVFENGQRAGEGEKLTFFAKSLHFYDLRS